MSEDLKKITIEPIPKSEDDIWVEFGRWMERHEYDFIIGFGIPKRYFFPEEWVSDDEGSHE